MFKELEAEPDWVEALSGARVNITIGTALMSYMLFRCRIAFTRDIETAGALVASNENIIYINPDFFMKELKCVRERAFVLLHEVLHIFLQHGDRLKNYPGTNPVVWNVANDYNVNLTCSGAYLDRGVVRKCEKYTRYFKAPEGALYDEKYIGLTSEEIYKLLIDGADLSSLPSNFDVHFESEPDSSKQTKKNKETMLSATIMATKSKTIGASEGELVLQMQRMSRPKVDWRDYISSTVSSLGSERMTYSRLSRRSQGRVKFPTYIGETVRIVFGVDSSGSMSDSDYSRVRGELFGLMSQFDNWEIHIVSCDTRLHKLGKFVKEDGHSFEDASVKFKGGGGTELTPIVKYAEELKEEDEDVDACIILTDGYIPDAIQNYFDTGIENIVLVTEGGCKNLILNNCKVIHIEE